MEFMCNTIGIVIVLAMLMPVETGKRLRKIHQAFRGNIK